MGGLGKVKRDALFFVKIILLLGFLYFFICSLDFLRTIFRLLGGKTAGEAFASNKILSTTAFRLLGGKTAGEAFASNKILSNTEDFIGCKRFASFYDFCLYWMQTLRFVLRFLFLLDANASLFSPSCSSSEIPASKYASLCFNVRKTKITVLQGANSREKKF